MKEKIEEWAVIFGHEIIEVRKTDKLTIVTIKSNIIMIPELKMLGYMTNREVAGIEMTKEYNRLEVWILNKE